MDTTQIYHPKLNRAKLSLTEYEFIKNGVAKTIRDDPQYRLGQAWFNELVAHIPEFGWIRATSIDPFYRDETLLDLFYHILDEEAYASWTHSDTYCRLHNIASSKYEATPVDISGSELSDFLESSEEDNIFEPFKKMLNSKLMENKTYITDCEPESTGTGLTYSGDYKPVSKETTNVRFNIATTRDPIESVNLLKEIADMLSTIKDIRIRNIEVSQW